MGAVIAAHAVYGYGNIQFRRPLEKRRHPEKDEAI